MPAVVLEGLDKRQSLFGQTSPTSNSTASASNDNNNDGSGAPSNSAGSEAWRYVVVVVLLLIAFGFISRAFLLRRRRNRLFLRGTDNDFQARQRTVINRRNAQNGLQDGLAAGHHASLRDVLIATGIRQPDRAAALTNSDGRQMSTFDRIASQARARVRAEGEADYRAAERDRIREEREQRRAERRRRRAEVQRQNEEGADLPTYTREVTEGEQMLAKADSVENSDDEDDSADDVDEAAAATNRPPAYPDPVVTAH